MRETSFLCSLVLPRDALAQTALIQSPRTRQSCRRRKAMARKEIAGDTVNSLSVQITGAEPITIRAESIAHRAVAGPEQGADLRRRASSGVLLLVAFAAVADANMGGHPQGRS
mmetsp:Transcript_2611/g.6308  ORF Transcript_2611/g.6308 Transcript_2611/m.6308 type:complete len:113 (-) Transcript_2611:164-502(-)